MARHIKIFDTTLRDGEQSAGCSMSSAEKLTIVRELLRLKVDIIEAGFPASSPGDFASVQEIAAFVANQAVVCALARAVAADVEAAGEALTKAQRGRIHTGLGVSPCHLKDKLNMSEDDALNSAVGAVKLARNYTDDVQFFAEDAGRANKTYLARVLEAVIQAGATTINVPDTTGALLPHQYGELISWLLAHVKGASEVTVAVHCHNDLGMATASSIAGVLAGASQVECTINGIGERAGNAALEEVAVALDLHGEEMGVECNISLGKLTRASRLVMSISGMKLSPHKAVVGANAFAHSSGIHQDGVLKNPRTYEIIDPVRVGARPTQIVLTGRSGRAALKHSLAELGYDLDEASFLQVHERFVSLADKKAQMYDEDLEALMAEHGRSQDALWKLSVLQVSCGTPKKATATIELEGPGGKKCTTHAFGTGPIDATFKAIDELVKAPQADLLRFAVQAITRGSDALGEVSVQLSNEQGQVFSGRGADGDIIVSSAKAYLNAINRLLAWNKA
ncbi:MAG: 2-isopropylmalate synthase [Coriobacteriia bacterium]|nr:2-isopropylmalate synthase [Coriobacteriia bacterium]